MGQFECKGGWTLLSTIKFDWSVNIRLMQDENWGSMWVGCDISWWNIMHSFKGFKMCAFSCCFICSPPDWRFSIKITEDYSKLAVAWSIVI